MSTTETRPGGNYTQPVVQLDDTIKYEVYVDWQLVGIVDDRLEAEGLLLVTVAGKSVRR